MTIPRRRLERIETAVRSSRRADVAHLLDGVVVPENGDRLAFVLRAAERVFEAVGDDPEARRLPLLDPLLRQLTGDELRELARPWPDDP